VRFDPFAKTTKTANPGQRTKAVPRSQKVADKREDQATPTKRGGLRRTSQSCRSYCASRNQVIAHFVCEIEHSVGDSFSGRSTVIRH
jgi:hypothetical protein